MPTVNERVKQVRMYLNLTQIQFGEKICMSQGQLTAVEHGKRNVTDRTIRMICTEFNISEEWLRYGTGEMIVSKDTHLIDELIKKYGFSDTIRQLFECFERLTPIQQKAVFEFAQRYIASLNDGPEVAEKVESYRQEILAEKDIATSSASQTGNDATA